MRRFIGLWALLILACTSCAKLAESAPEQEAVAECRLTLSLSVPESETVTRSLTPEAEKSVSDLNLYLLNEAVDKHFFISPCASSVTLNVPSGSYELFLIANTGSDLGNMTRQQVEDYRYRINAESDLEKNGRLLMCARQRIHVQNDTELNLVLSRLAAKVEIRYSVAPQAGALTLNSIQIKSAANSVPLFGQERKADAVVDYAAHTLTHNAGTLTAYVLENCQGVNSSVYVQELKDSAHAPQNSTYVIVRGTYADKAVAYRIYLGENNTSDFNVRENRHYVLNVEIFGANPSDYRVSVSEISFTPLNTTYPLGTTAQTTVTLTNQTDADNTYSLSFRTENADVVIDGHGYVSGDEILVLAGIGSRQIQVGIRGRGPGLAASVVFTVTDKYGVQFTKTVSTKFVSTGPPIVITSTPFSSPYTNTVSTFQLTISESGYAGNFSVKLISDVEPPGVFTFNGENLDYNFERTVAPGTYAMTFNATNFVGQAILSVSVKDNKGQSAEYQVVQTISATKAMSNQHGCN